MLAMPVHIITPVKTISQCTLITARSAFIQQSYELDHYDSNAEN